MTDDRSTDAVDTTQSSGGGLLDLIERIGNRLPDPATLFVLGTLFIMFLSAVAASMDWTVVERLPVQVTEVVTNEAGETETVPVLNEEGEPVINWEETGNEYKATSLLTRDGLFYAINTMVDSLNALILQVKHSTIQLVSTATRISGAAKSQEGTIQDFGASTQQIATAVNEISTTSKQLLDTMRDVSESANATTQSAEEGRRQLANMGGSMDNLSTATNSIAGKLAVISEKANNITRVVTTINKVSEQTNLLSLNAAIEAEKAGEHGQGFAVVAREIRRLAHQTAQATVNISQMVNEMQAAVSSGVMEMDKFNESVRTGVEKVSELGERLDEVIAGVQRVAPQFVSVREGMEAQTQGAQQISVAMTNLRDGAQRTQESLREFDEATRALHAAVNGLRREVSRFKVKEKGSSGVTGMPFPMRRSPGANPPQEVRAPFPPRQHPEGKTAKD